MRIFSDYDNNGAGSAGSNRDFVKERIRANLVGVGATVAFASAKGGVGKSVLAVNIAASLALKGRKVAILDADLNSPSITAMLGIKLPRHLPMIEGIEPVSGPHGLRVISSDMVAGGEPAPISFAADDSEITIAPAHAAQLSYSEALERMLAQSSFGAVDVLIVDIAPGLDRLHSIAALVPLDLVLLVSHPSALAARAARHAIEIAHDHGKPAVRIVENMVGFNCDGCRAVRPLWPEGDLQGVARDLAAPIIARLAFEPRLADSSDRGLLFVREYASTPTAKGMADLVTQVESMLGARKPAQASL